MDLAVLGGPDEGPVIQLDHERFAYAGKFVMTSTGKAVVREGDEVLGATAFNRDRTDDGWWIRYVTVRTDRRGEGIGPALLDFTATHLLDRGAEAVRIAVNNPFAYEACYKAGFGYTGRETGMAEVVLERPTTASAASYRAGLETLRAGRDLSAPERSFIDEHLDRGPPDHGVG